MIIAVLTANKYFSLTNALVIQYFRKRAWQNLKNKLDLREITTEMGISAFYSPNSGYKKLLIKYIKIDLF